METKSQGLSQENYHQHSELQEIDRLVKTKLQKMNKKPSSFISVKPKKSISRVKSVKKLQVVKALRK